MEGETELEGLKLGDMEGDTEGDTELDGLSDGD